MTELPSEFSIQSASGVYETLKGLPLYETVMPPRTEEIKKGMSYHLWARSTINYDEAGCEVSKQAAIEALRSMEDASGTTDLTFTCLMMGAIFPLMLFIFYIRFICSFFSNIAADFAEKEIVGLIISSVLLSLY